VHRSVSKPQASKFPSHASRGSQRASNHYARPSSRSALSPAACTRTGSRDRSTCTACTSATRIHISGTGLRPNSPHPAARSHIAHIVKQHEFPEDSQALGQGRGPTAADRSCALAAASAAFLDGAVRDRCPDIQVVGIWPKKPPQARLVVLSTRVLLCGKCVIVAPASGRLSHGHLPALARNAVPAKADEKES
jgi:hypothetical protein